MKRPLLPVALLFVVGILLAERIRLPLTVLFAACLATALAGLAWDKGRLWLLGLLIALTGWTDAAWHNAILAPGDLRVTQGDNVSETGLRGCIRAPPAQRVFELGRRELWRSSALIDASEMSQHGGWQPVSGKVIATTAGVLSPEFFEGQRVELHGVLRRPNGPLAEGLFDPRAYYQRQDVFYQLQTGGTNDWAAAAGGEGELPLSERFRRWATRTLELGFPAEDGASRLTRTLMLDWKAPLTDTVEEPFMRAGTYHIFAEDGLRIGLLAMIGVGLLRGLQFPRAACGVVVAPALWFYVCLTGWPASAIRAAIMATVVILGWACRRPGDVFNSLFAAAFIILLWDPGQLFLPGFQLSFLVVGGIALIVPSWRKLLRDKLLKGDPMLADTLKPRLPPLLFKAATYAVDVFAVSCAAWVGSIPLAAYYFHLFTPVSVPANCVVVPVTALALISGTGSLLTGGWCSWLAILFNNATWGLMHFIIWFSGWAARWSFGNFNVAAPPITVCVLYYAALFLVASGWVFRSRHKWWMSAALLAAGMVCLVQWRIERQTARVSILPLRGSAAVFVDFPADAGTLLLNCGGVEDAEGTVKPFLCAHGVNHLDAFCVGVGLRSYFGGADVIRTNFEPRQVFSARDPGRSAADHELIETLRQTGRWQAGRDGGALGGWAVLHPPEAAEGLAQADDNALVLWREVHGHSVLLLPSLGRDGQEALMRRHPHLRAEIVLAGLPAREEPLCEPLLDLLQPRLIVIMDTTFPATRRASGALRARFARRPSPVIYCRDHGALTLELATGGWTVRNAAAAPVTAARPAETPEE
ncbi:MAG: ComEC/Rec2 family competence protein [Limisphaerales bacterium]